MLIDYGLLLENVRRVQGIADSHGVVLRPHIKTHKCLEIARLQLAEGAVGITASKTEEAIAFIDGGLPSLTVAYPLIDPAKVDRLLVAAGQHGTELRLITDSDTSIDAIASAASRRQVILDVLLKIDVGLHRCGVKENSPDLLRLARRLESEKSLRFAGLLSHAGHAYRATTPEEVADVAREECAILGRVRNLLKQHSIEVSEVSVGSTPTVLASDSYEGITEIRPGNYVFMDNTCVRLGLITPDRVALSVMATVVSANREYLVVDAGSKTLSSDLGAHGTGGSMGYGTAYPLGSYSAKKGGVPVVNLSEEHGWLRREDTPLRIGSRVRIIPNHACPVANLADEYVVLGEERHPLRWRVAARGCVR